MDIVPWIDSSYSSYFTSSSYLLTCGEPVDSAGNACGLSFAPTFNLVLPDSGGMPELNIDIPEFGGIDINAVMKALEMLGLDPCSMIQALAGPVLSMATALVAQMQASAQGIIDFPQDALNGAIGGLQGAAQGAVDGVFSSIPNPEMFETCEGIAGMVGNLNGAMVGDFTGVTGDMLNNPSSVTGGLAGMMNSAAGDLGNINNELSSLDARLTALGG